MRLKYPRFTLILATFVFAYLLFADRYSPELQGLLVPLGYAGILAAGIFYSYGFTSAPAAALILIMATGKDIFLASALAGLGALIGDLVIFNIIKHSFKEEIDMLADEKFAKRLAGLVPTRLRRYILPVVGAAVIASPLPDEIGISMLAMSKDISEKKFALLSFLLNSVGIFVILKLAGV